MRKMKYVFLVSLIILSGLFAPVVLAQEVPDLPLQGIAVDVIIEDGQDAPSGSLICATDAGYVLCSEEYAQNLYGVINDTPAVSFESDQEGARLVVSDGVARVRVSNVDGAIGEGDLITSSDSPGIGKLATRNGYVVGTALESMNDAEGEILVSLRIYASASLSDAGTNLLETVKQVLEAPLIGPVATLRYLVSAIMVILSFVLSFVWFGRVVRTGVEATGRNPLARGTIQGMVFFNIFISLAIVGAGLGIAYFILTI